MPELLHPGVYVLEVPSASKPIEGISTSTAGFVGVAERGPVAGFPMPFGAKPRPPLLTSFAEYARIFGGYRDDSFLTYAVQNFFDNGGKRAYIARVVIFDDPVTSTNPMPNARLAAAGLLDREAAANPTLAVIARNPGHWANTVGISVLAATLDPAHSFKLLVLEDGIPVESFDELSMDPASDAFVENVVNSRSTVVMVKAVLPAGVSHDDARPASSHTVRLLADGSAPALDVSSPVFLGGPLTITTKRDASSGFSLQVTLWGKMVESFDRLSMNPALGNYVERKINPSSSFIKVAVPPSSPLVTDYDKARPVDGDVSFPAQPAPGGLGITAGAGLDGRTPDQGDMHFLGRGDLGTGLHAFDGVPDVNILAIPGQGNDLIISGGMAYCKNRALQDAFFVADLGLSSPANSRQPGSAPNVNDKNAARDFVRSLSTPNDYGAIYYPWVRASDPIGSGRNPTILLPPSGFIAGLYARIDNSRGVFKAPAGTETGLAGALGLSDDVHDADQDIMNPIGLNAIRRFPIYGIVSWGTRTLSTDAAWRYIPVRRMAIFLRGSIYNGIQWAVFEPNDEPLWSSLRLNIRSFMQTQFRAGAFQGASPADAFFVKCDATTTTQSDIDLGIVNILVGFAPLKPAEFVVLKLSQKINLPAA
jgi:phage tail sheath protein FI